MNCEDEGHAAYYTMLDLLRTLAHSTPQCVVDIALYFYYFDSR